MSDGQRNDPRMGTPLGRVRGLGSAEAGAEHWWHERLTSIAAFLLFAWFIASLLRLPDLDYRTLALWLASPLAAIPMILLIIATFWHLKMGLQVIIEDYVHEDGSKLFWVTILNFLSLIGAVSALFALLKIAFAGGAG